MKKAIVRVISTGLFIASVFAILMSVVILAGVAAGYALHYLVPAIDLGSAAIASVLAFGIAVYSIVQFVRLVVNSQLEVQTEDDEEDGIDPEFISNHQVETIADLVSEAVIMKTGSRPNRRSPSRHRR